MDSLSLKKQLEAALLLLEAIASNTGSLPFDEVIGLHQASDRINEALSWINQQEPTDPYNLKKRQEILKRFDELIAS